MAVPLLFLLSTLLTLFVHTDAQRPKCPIPAGNINLHNEIVKCCKTFKTPGDIVLSGDVSSPPIELKEPSCNGVTIDLNDKTVSAPTSTQAWGAKKQKYWAYFLVQSLKDITVKNGVINGNGKPWWSTGTCKEKEIRPNLVHNLRTTKMTWSNLRLIDSPKYSLVAQSSKDTLVDSVVIKVPYTRESCNLDGIQTSNADGVTIRNTEITAGDDCVAIKSGSNNVVVENTIFHAGHGASIGSIQKGTVTNVIFRNIKFRPGPGQFVENGARIKTWATGVGFVYNITFDGFDMDGTENPIVIDTKYGGSAAGTPKGTQAQRETTLINQGKPLRTALIQKAIANIKAQGISHPFAGVLIDTVTFKNFVGKNIPAKQPPSIECQANSPCTNVVLENIVLDQEITCSNVFGKATPPLSPSSFTRCVKPARGTAKAVSAKDESNTSSAPSSILPTTTLAVIVICSVVAVVLVIGLAMFFVKRNRQGQEAV